MSDLKTAIAALGELIESAETILVLQPEKPDSDSLSVSLAFEELLENAGKKVIMYCQDKIPSYISYYHGADRVVDRFPDKFDLTILVDCGSPRQIERTLEKHQVALTKQPFAIVDHHANRQDMAFEATQLIDPTSTSTCELLVKIAKQLDWPLTKPAADAMIPGVLADTRNLSIPTTTAETFEVMATLLRAGGDLNASHDAYRKVSALSSELVNLKGRLLARAEFPDDGNIAVVAVTAAETAQWAEIHDPSDLVIYELQRTKGVVCAVVLREYTGGKIKVSTRANAPVAAKTCEAFGGGGHDRAAGCTITDQPIAAAQAAFIKELTHQIKDYHAAV